MASNKPPQNPQEHLQQMNILHIALLAGQVMMVLFLFFAMGRLPNAEEAPDAMTSLGGIDSKVLVVCLVFAVLVFASFLIFNKRKAEGIRLKGTLMEKLNHYRQSFVLRAALIEMPTLIVVVFYFFIEDHIVLIPLFIIGIAVFFMIRPTADRISQDYQLSGSEQSSLRNVH